MKPYIKHIVILFIVGILLVSSAGCEVASDIFRTFQTVEEVHDRHAPSSDSGVIIRNQNGHISIANSDDEDIHIKATMSSFWAEKLQQTHVSTYEDDSEVIIETIFDSPDLGVSVDYEILIPRNVDVKYVKTSNGQIDVENISGDTQVETSNGNINMTNVGGYVIAETSNGTVEVHGCAGVDDIKTSNGNINVDISSIRSDVNIETSNGSIEAIVSRGLNADLFMNTSNAQISYQHSEISVLSEDTTEVEGILADGGPDLNLLTSNGHIELIEGGW